VSIMITMPKQFTPDQYSQLGSELEHASEADQRAFGKAYADAGDTILSTLAAFARASAGGKHHRLAGRISVALMWERVAEREYNRLPEQYRW
jgi:hypothetical protein